MIKRCNLFSGSHQRGTVLIVALFVMALLEITIVGLVLYHRIEIRHATQYLHAQEAMQMALGGEAWAQSQIYQYFKAQKNLNRMKLPKKSLNGGYVEVELLDIQGHFNLNNLLDSSKFVGFINMMSSLSPQNTQFSDRIIELVQKNATMSAANNLPNDLFNFPLLTITQIRGLPEMTEALFVSLLPHLFAVPAIAPLNVNTATEYSLMSLDPKLTLDKAKALVHMRNNVESFTSVEAFLALEPMSGIVLDPTNICIISEFYLSSVTVHFQGVHLTLYSLLRITKNEDKYIQQVYWRSVGTI